MSPEAPRWFDRRYAIAALLLAVPAVVLAALASVHATFPGDEWALARAQALGAGFEPVAAVFNQRDGVLAAALLVSALLLLAWRRNVDAILAVVLAAAVLRPLLQPLKELVGRPRPSGDFEVRHVVEGLAFPSGHVMTAVVVFGVWLLLAPELLPRRWVLPARALCVAAIALMAVSRQWAGVHWLSDTYGGVLWAGAAMALAMAARPAFARLTRRAFERERVPAVERLEA